MAGEQSNIIRNSGFECNLNRSWKIKNALQDTNSYKGSFSIKIKENGKKDWNEYIIQENLRVLPKTSYKFKLMTKVSFSNGLGIIKINLYDSQHVLLTSKQKSFYPSVSWRPFTFFFSTPKKGLLRRSYYLQ